MNYGEIKKTDIANGPGVRVSLFVSGCTHKCPGCFNEVAWDFGYGRAFDKGVQEELLEALAPKFIAGLTILGGEPFEPENQTALLPFIRRVREQFPNKNIWIYTGYVFDTELLGESRARCDATDEILSMTDVIVDGPFVEAEKDITLRFKGSRNQRIIDVRKSLKSGSVAVIG